MATGLYRAVGRGGATPIGPPGANIGDFAQLSRVQVFIAGLDVMRSGALLGAYLTYPLIHARGLNDAWSLFDGQGQRLLDIDVFARIERIDGNAGVPVVRCCHHHSIEAFDGEQVAMIGKDGGARSGRACLLSAGSPHIAYRREWAIELLKGRLQLSRSRSAADEADGETIIRAQHPGLRSSSQSCCAGNCDKSSTIHGWPLIKRDYSTRI